MTAPTDDSDLVPPVQLVLIAKEPRPGFVKTRLCPPCTPDEAAQIARAALVMTLQTMQAVPASRYVVALDGAPGDWFPPGFDLIPQRGGGLGDRLQGIFDDCFAYSADPVVVVAMDTPQITPAQLQHAARLLHDGSSAVLGPANDGGYWLIGLRHGGAALFAGVPMSTARAHERQVTVLRANGYRVAKVDELRDIDEPDDARLVAAALSGTEFAALVHRILGPSADEASSR